MKIPIPSSFRARIFTVLALVSLIPAALTLAAGLLVVREVVVSTGSAGAWGQVAESGRELFDEIRTIDAPPLDVVTAAERHEATLAESVRFSRIYSFLGERILTLLPLFSLVLLVLIGTLALVVANWLARDFARPVEELVGWTRALAAGRSLPESPDGRERGEIREFSGLRAALRDASRELDVSRRRELERERMRSWSEMARRVAHDLKNPLTPMRMAADRVAGAADPSLAQAGEVLREEIDRLDALARSFAHFGRPPEGPMCRIDIGELVTTLARRLSTESLPITAAIPDEPVVVTGHFQAIERVIRNLVSNAQEARPGEGGEAPSGGAIQLEVSTDSVHVEIRVSDRGPGIADEVLDRIWEPDFTSKPRGTGLGLPFVRQVVESHGGTVAAGNREGAGAVFTVRLPEARES